LISFLIYFICVLTLLSSVLDTCAPPDSPPGIHIPTRLGSFTDSPGFSCPGYGARSVWILPVTAQSGAAVAWISSRPSRATSFQAPCMPLEFPLSKLVSALFLFILVHFLVYLYVSALLCCSYMYISCTLAFAHICDVLLL